ncbi:MAG: Hsp20/alpha crystallin family protein [Candidatus Brocadiales bacterium]|nr:Hsp20/alpha crystallin family protein [Candidatus Brocadiales bacterium]
MIHGKPCEGCRKRLINSSMLTVFLLRQVYSTVVFPPPIDVVEEQGEFRIYCELPGQEKEDITLSVASNVLTIKGQRQAEAETENEKRKYYRRETHTGFFQRTISLPPAADVNQIKAELTNGILFISIPKKKEAIPKQITVKVQ